MGDHDVHGWIVAALLRETACLEGQARYESAESTLSFARCIRQGSCRSPQALAQNGHVDPGKCRTRMGEEKDGRACGNPRRTISPDLQFVGTQLLDHVSPKGTPGEDDEGSDCGTWNRNQQVCGGQALMPVK